MQSLETSVRLQRPTLHKEHLTAELAHNASLALLLLVLLFLPRRLLPLPVPRSSSSSPRLSCAPHGTNNTNTNTDALMEMGKLNTARIRKAVDPRIMDVKKRVRQARRNLKRESKVVLSDEIIFFDDVAGNEQAKVVGGGGCGLTPGCGFFRVLLGLRVLGLGRGVHEFA